jgi:hypothetical protein
VSQGRNLGEAALPRVPDKAIRSAGISLIADAYPGCGVASGGPGICGGRPRGALVSAARGEIASYERTALVHRMGDAEDRRRAREVNGLDPDPGVRAGLGSPAGGGRDHDHAAG